MAQTPYGLEKIRQAAEETIYQAVRDAYLAGIGLYCLSGILWSACRRVEIEVHGDEAGRPEPL